MSHHERGSVVGEGNLGGISHPRNPDRQPASDNPFVLRPENTPKHLHHLFGSHQFRRLTIDEILNSEHLTQDAWPGATPTNQHDLRARNLINEPVCGAFTNDGEMIAYSRLLWGYDNQGRSEVHSHMTAVASSLRNGGVGEALKWQTRQVALEFPKPAVTQQSVTFDNQQGRIAHVNLNKLGMICGAAGGAYKRDVYGEFAEQHRGNPTDRYLARWYLDSDWVQAHLEEKVRLFPIEEAKSLPSTVQFGYVELSGQSGRPVLPVPKSVDTQLDQPYITLPIPLDWDEFLRLDAGSNRVHANQWRQAHRAVLDTYHANGYTTVLQATDRDAGVNLQVLAKDFDPYRPPAGLLSA